MFNNFPNISVSFSIPGWLIFVVALLSIMLAVFVYRHTIPPIRNIWKIVLITLRSLSLMLLAFLLFDMLLKLVYEEQNPPKHFFFIDSSTSVVSSDSSERVNYIMSYLKEKNNYPNLNVEMFRFSSDVEPLSDIDSIPFIFKGPLTSLEAPINFLREYDENIASATFLTDGIINLGKDPLALLDGLNFPVNTIGVGDTTEYEDIKIADVIHEKYVYANNPTILKAIISSSGKGDVSTTAHLFKGNQLISTKPVKIIANNTTSIDFNYTPTGIGNEILRVEVNPFMNEKLTTNNSRQFPISVLKDKINVLMLVGTPSVDAAFLKKTISANEKYQLVVSDSHEDMNVLNNEFMGKQDVLLLINYPAKNTPTQQVNKVVASIRNGKPFLIQISETTDLNKLKILSDILPYSISQSNNEVELVTVNIRSNNFYKSLLGNLDKWNNIPPVVKGSYEIVSNNPNDVLLSFSSKIDKEELPVAIINNKINKSFSLFAFNIWKWKLQFNDAFFFDEFVNNILDWLSTDSNLEKFSASPNKYLYKPGEEVIIKAELYDEILNPISDSNIMIELNSKDYHSEGVFISRGNGSYEYSVQNIPPGNYQFTAKSNIDNQNNETKDSFQIEIIPAEELDFNINSNLLKNIAATTKGNFYYIWNTEGSWEYLQSGSTNKIKVKRSSSSIDPKNYSLILILIISLLSIEWFLRKKFGMN